MDSTIMAAPIDRPDPDKLAITTTNVDLTNVASVDLTLTLAVSNTQAKTIKHTFKVSDQNTVDKNKGSLTLSSKELSDVLIEQFKAGFGADPAPDMPVTMTTIDRRFPQWEMSNIFADPDDRRGHW